MKKIIISVLILIIAAVASYYFVFKNLSGDEVTEYTPKTDNSGDMMMSTTSTETQTTATTTTSSNSQIKNVLVTIKNFNFDPNILSVKVGTKVTWTNEDSMSHTVTSKSGTILNSPTLQTGESFSYTFNTPGIYNYHCTIHPTMEALVEVTN